MKKKQAEQYSRFLTPPQGSREPSAHSSCHCRSCRLRCKWCLHTLACSRLPSLGSTARCPCVILKVAAQTGEGWGRLGDCAVSYGKVLVQFPELCLLARQCLPAVSLWYAHMRASLCHIKCWIGMLYLKKDSRLGFQGTSFNPCCIEIAAVTCSCTVIPTFP